MLFKSPPSNPFIAIRGQTDFMAWSIQQDTTVKDITNKNCLFVAKHFKNRNFLQINAEIEQVFALIYFLKTPETVIRVRNNEIVWSSERPSYKEIKREAKLMAKRFDISLIEKLKKMSISSNEDLNKPKNLLTPVISKKLSNLFKKSSEYESSTSSDSTSTATHRNRSQTESLGRSIGRQTFPRIFNKQNFHKTQSEVQLKSRRPLAEFSKPNSSYTTSNLQKDSSNILNESCITIPTTTSSSNIMYEEMRSISTPCLLDMDFQANESKPLSNSDENTQLSIPLCSSTRSLLRPKKSLRNSRARNSYSSNHSHLADAIFRCSSSLSLIMNEKKHVSDLSQINPVVVNKEQNLSKITAPVITPTKSEDTSAKLENTLVSRKPMKCGLVDLQVGVTFRKPIPKDCYIVVETQNPWESSPDNKRKCFMIKDMTNDAPKEDKNISHSQKRRKSIDSLIPRSSSLRRSGKFWSKKH